MNSTLQTVRTAWGSLQLSAMGVVLLSCCAVPGVQAQTTTSPTISLSPAVLQTSQAAPANGNFIAPASISLTATATAASGSSISQVQFYQGATLIATASAPTIANGNSYSVNWTNVTANSYSVTAKATDSANATATSTAVTVNVINNNPPSVSLTANPVNATAPATIILNATATDTDGTVAKVEFFNGTTTIATITTAPFTTNWTNVAQGTYSITARATDNLGAVTTSVSVPVSVTANVPKAYDIHSDQLNTPRVITDANGNEVWRWDSAPFGETAPNEQPTTVTNKFTFNFRFPGQYFDAETNLHYNYFRDYDPQAGRYVESDPIGLSGGINTFGYVGGNPINNSDPSGLIANGKKEGDTVTITIPIYIRSIDGADIGNFSKNFNKNVTSIWKKVKYGKCWVVFQPEIHPDFRQGDNVGNIYPPGFIKREYVGGVGYRNMHVNSDSSPGVIAHEVGHLMYADDHYTDVKGKGSVPNKGWESDIMANSNMPPTSKSIGEILKKLNLDCECK
ncbi:RHS repeat-associated core domain-containing protein [Undibacterium sp. Ji50W]|uniref:RHS repeat-associated core domain-containing protein n=1 Tax=Undibacterium sp. Ji50W TaxID=3413041 RepID=UPI003BF3FB70